MTGIANGIRRCTESDLKAVLDWLQDEEEAVAQDVEAERGFWCNRGIIERARSAGRCWVLVDLEEIPLAFAVLGADAIDILEVHPHYRGLGLGRLLAECMIGVLRYNGACLVTIECKPISSVPFWRAIGFAIEDPGQHSGRSPEGFLALGQHRQLPHDAKRASVRIRAFPESAKWERNTPWVREWTPTAAWVDENLVVLSERLILSPRLLGLPANTSVVIEIAVDGESLVTEKARHLSAFGVTADSADNLFIDEVRPRARIEA